MPRLVKLTILIIAIIFNFKIAFGVKIGLDSGHSIKELYKSGGTFLVWKYNPDTDRNEQIPYYSLGWPAGGISIENNKGSSTLNMRKMVKRLGAIKVMWR